MGGRTLEPAVTPRTVGVEEEFLLVGATTGEPVPLGPRLAADAADPDIRTEFKQEQVEITSRPCSSMAELARDLDRLRRRVGELAAARDGLVVASGTWPGAHDPVPTESERFTRIAHEFGHLAEHQLTCGTHVHVSVSSPEEGIVALDGIRPWLSVLTALTANSPFWQGRDTGHASFRSVVLSQLPTAGPTQVWNDVDTYRRAATQIIDVGGAFDEGMLYYDARLSARYPTVEVRVTDVCPDPGVAVAVAALCRALVTTMAEGSGRRSDLPTSTLRAAAWRAARHGLADRLVDPATGDLVTAALAVESLLRATRESLEAVGDLALVRETVDRVVREGGAARRQRGEVDPAAPAPGLRSFLVGGRGD
ncbi:hypothetical protein N801_14725 [Knoellia aerolata DSM 18566]|uniref:Putative glutamate--cysteine ligase 2 n=1 Tax=Knoellia aerolata DSM 18566 TaxID=1385519 RepID=A0A0A0JUF4_9MICO|nr:hypothetical protein N801_14725 [Knoellia aerolata DSM 18566]